MSSCATSGAVLTPVSYDARLLQPCVGPVITPNRELTRAEIVRFYNTNRDHLVDCKERHWELRSQILKAEATLDGKR